MDGADATRRTSSASSYRAGKPSLAGLSLRLSRTKSKPTIDEKDEDIPATSKQFSLEAFFAMPNEIQVEILCFVELKDILTLRATCKAFSEILAINVSVLTRQLLRQGWMGDDPIFLNRLYPFPPSIKNFDFFLRMVHLQSIVTKTISAIGFYVQRKFYRYKTDKAVAEFAPGRKRLEERLFKPAVIVYHFLETYRATLAAPDYVPGDVILQFGPLHPRRLQTFDHSLQGRLLAPYSVDELTSTFNFYRIMVSCYRQKLRPPPEAGTLERRIRGCTEPPPSDMPVMWLLLYGCMDDVKKILVLGNYNSRCRAFDAALDRLYERSERAAMGPAGPSHDVTSPRIPPMPRHFQNPPRGYWETPPRLTDLYFPWLKSFYTVAGGQMDVRRTLELIENPFDMLALLIKEDTSTAPALETGPATDEAAATTENASEQPVDDGDVVLHINNTLFTEQLYPTQPFPSNYGISE